MGKNLKATQGTSSAAGVLMTGIAVSLLVTLVGAAICAALISAETIAESSSGYCVMIVVLLSVVVGATVSIGKGSEKRLYISLGLGAIYLLVLLATTALFFGGQYQGVGVTALVVFSGCILAVLLNQNRGKILKSRRSKIRRR